jgi:hypothetical protein
MSALEAAVADDGPTGASGHAVPEAVTPGPSAVVGLEGALHDVLLVRQGK